MSRQLRIATGAAGQTKTPRCFARLIVTTQDGNTGLVKLVLAGRTKRAIQRLTQTFLTLSLADIAEQVGLENASEAEGHILRYTTV